MAYRQFCSWVACPNYREIRIMGEIGDDVFFCDQHADTKYVRCAEDYCSNLWVFDYDHEVPSAPAKDATDWLCDEHEPKPAYIPVTCTEDGCEVSTRFLAGRGIRDGHWRCAAHGMSVILTCMGDDCTVTHQFERGDNIPDGFFCPEHGAEEARKLVDHVRSIPCLPPKPSPQIHHAPEGKVIVKLTPEQQDHLTELLKQHGDPQLGLRPMPPLYTDRIKDLEQQVDIAMKALERIYCDPDGECLAHWDMDIQKWTEHVAKEAIDAIRKLRA